MQRIVKALKTAGEAVVFAGMVLALVVLLMLDSILGGRGHNSKCDDWGGIYLGR